MNPNLPPEQKLSISRKVTFGIVFTLSMLVMIALVSFISMRNFLTLWAEIAEGREVLERSERVQRYFIDMENGVRGYLLTGDSDDLNPYDHGLSFIIQELKALSWLTNGDSEQQAHIVKLQAIVGRAFAVHGRVIEKRREGLEAAVKLLTDPMTVKESHEAFSAVRDELHDLSQGATTRLSQLQETLERNRTVNNALIFGGTGLTFIALCIAGMLILRDIAERKRAEEQLAEERNLLRSIMDTIPDSLFVKDMQGRYTRDNAAHRRFLGLQEEETIRGKRTEDFEPDFAMRYISDDAEILSGGKGVVQTIEPARGANGKLVWLETTKVPLLDRDGRCIGLVGLSSDVTKRREDEEKLKDFAVALQKSNEELQSFASVASHDLQEPLRKIQSFGNLLTARHSAQLGEQGADYVRRMMDAASRMQTLIQDLLKLSRIATRAQPFERCDLNEIVNGVLSDLEVKITSSGARVTSSGLCSIEADPTQMRQLFQNLLANALKFQKPGVRPEVSIKARIIENGTGGLLHIPRGAELCEVRVQDNGIGFNPQFAEQIFSPFKRLHARTEYEGSGIGLTVCRKITDRHRGRIVAESADGAGAAFIVTLPVNQPATHERRSEAYNHPDGR